MTANIANLGITIANPDQNGGLTGKGDPTILPTLLLQRLACPELPYNAATNPFITVDYFVFQGQVNDARQYLSQNNANPGANANLQLISAQNSYVHRQPYAAYSDKTGNSQIVMFTLTNPAPPAGAAMATPDNSTMNHSFFRHNGASVAGQAGWANGATAPTADTLDYQFEWLVQLDRGLISPIEALYVSAYRPWELTQQFIYGGTWWAAGSTSTNQGVSTTVSATYRHKHLAVWDDNTTRLFRALAMFETPNRTQGMGLGGRLPGKVNINTIWNSAIFQSICDANANGSNYFTSVGLPASAWASLSSMRTPGGTTLSQNDQPFWGLGLPIDNTGSLQFPLSQYPNGFGVENTILRHTAATVHTTYQGPSVKITDNTLQTHPYLKNEMLNKIYNNLTTRSNTFAVWMTVGYFEVVNPGPFNDTNRPILGQELGINEGTNVRHKFFAVVDRTKITTDPTISTSPGMQGTSPVYFNYDPANAVPLSNDPLTNSGMAASVNVNVPATYGVTGSYLTGTYDGTPWTITVGSTFTIAPDTQQGPGAVSSPYYPAGNGVVNGYGQTATVTGISFTQGTPATGQNPAISNTAQITLSLPAGNVQAYRGAVMILNQSTPPGQAQVNYGVPGNPGPQNGFNYRDPRYSAVVPYAAQIK